jgi:hypothetical protein
MPNARFTVGENEKHEIYLQSSFWTGNIKVDVDGKRVVDGYNIGLTKTVTFPIGEKEKHEVMIKMTPTNSFELYVDGKFSGRA